MLNQLNPAQNAAIEHIDGPLLVLAGAGSGKTRTIIQKIFYLVDKKGINPKNIFAVTFTNKAAREMESRAKAQLGSQRSKGLNVATFHALGLRVLQQEISALGYRKGFSIFDSNDVNGLLNELCQQTSGNDEATNDSMAGIISGWKSALISPSAALSLAKNAQEEHASRVYVAYQECMKNYNAVDFDDLVALPVMLFEQYPDIRERWQNRVRYLLVDEYQDTNGAQYRLMKALTGPLGRFTVVGDDDQSIYAWRGADPENMLTLSKDFPNVKVIPLEQNYRSTPRILRAANQLIANNPHVFEKKLWSNRDEGRKIRILPCKSALDEAERIAAELMYAKINYRGVWDDYAILYRSNHQARLFEQHLRQHQIPYKISGGQSFFDRIEIKDLLAYLRLVANPDDDVAFLRIINVPRRAIGPTTLSKLGEFARQREQSLFAASCTVGIANVLSPRTAGALQQFTDWITRLHQQIEDEPALELAKSLIQDIDYQDWLEETSNDPKQAERRWKNVEELFNWMTNINQYAEAQDNNPKPLPEMLNHMLLMDRLARDEEGDTEQMQLMTLHAAKGLEFKHVFIVGAEEELLPHRDSVLENLEEERRLAYVGLTRAKDTLSISYATKRQRYGEVFDCTPSRFLDELPLEDLEWEGRTENDKSPEQRQQHGKSQLAGLRDLLK